MCQFDPSEVTITSELPNNCREEVDCPEDPEGCRAVVFNTQCPEMSSERVLLEFDPNSDTAFQANICCTNQAAGDEWILQRVYVPNAVRGRDLVIKSDYFSLEYVGIIENKAVAKLTFKAATFNSDTQYARRCGLSWAIRKNKDIIANIILPKLGWDGDVLLQFPGAC